MWIFLGFPAALLLSGFLHRLWSDRRTVAAAIALSALLIASQINRAAPVGLDVADRMQIANSVPPPPASCRSFFMVDHIAPDLEGNVTVSLYEDNVMAMMISDHIDLPTINGFATFTPKDWNFAAAPKATYLSRVSAFATAHHLAGLCGYDAVAHSWTAAPFAAPAPPT